jgi:hypothetical protein
MALSADHFLLNIAYAVFLKSLPRLLFSYCFV